MRSVAITLLMSASALVSGQVQLDKPLVLVSPDSARRGIEGLAPGTQNDALVTMGDARSGMYHWAQAGGTGTAITLAAQPPVDGYADGLVLRFLPSSASYGPVSVNVDGAGTRRLYRTDGHLITAGQMQPGTIAEIIYTDTAFYLRNRAPEGCPSGFLPANERLCFMRNDTINLSIYNAAKWCSDRGASLCTWDEYIHACTVLDGQLEGMFDDWEWIDDTSDHTHTGVQVGRWQCRSERSYGAVENPNNYARVRCCYRK